jgi:serine/threonine-protein kinase
LHRSIQYFTEAIAADQRFAMAYSGLADSYTLLADYGFVYPSEAMPEAEKAAKMALDLDPQLGEAEASLGLICSIYEWNWDQAESHFLRSIELNPGYATVHFWYAIDHLAMSGRFAEAQVQIRIAQELDPLSPLIREAFGFLELLNRQYDAAIAHYREELELDPYFYKGHTSLGRAYIQKGMYREAIGHLEKGRLLAGDIPNILGALGQAWGLSGSADKARRFLAELQQLSKGRYVPCTGMALIHLGLGEKEKALDLLESGCEQRQPVLASLKVHPAYDTLREEPRFKAILKRIGLLPG